MLHSGMQWISMQSILEPQVHIWLMRACDTYLQWQGKCEHSSQAVTQIVGDMPRELTRVQLSRQVSGNAVVYCVVIMTYFPYFCYVNIVYCTGGIPHAKLAKFWRKIIILQFCRRCGSGELLAAYSLPVKITEAVSQVYIPQAYVNYSLFPTVTFGCCIVKNNGVWKSLYLWCLKVIIFICFILYM